MICIRHEICSLCALGKRHEVLIGHDAVFMGQVLGRVDERQKNTEHRTTQQEGNKVVAI